MQSLVIRETAESAESTEGSEKFPQFILCGSLRPFVAAPLHPNLCLLYLPTNSQVVALSKRKGGSRRPGAIWQGGNRDEDIAIHLAMRTKSSRKLFVLPSVLSALSAVFLITNDSNNNLPAVRNEAVFE